MHNLRTERFYNTVTVNGRTAAADGPACDLLPVSSVSEQGINRETLESHVGNPVEVITMRPVEASIAASTTSAADLPQNPLHG